MISQLEDSLRRAVSAERLQRHLEVFSGLHRHSGTDEEWQAARYVVETVRGHGIEAEILELDALISWPLAGSLTVVAADGTAVEIAARTRSFGAQTPAGGIETELVRVPATAPQPGEMIFSHRGTGVGDYSGLDVSGKVVLTTDGGPDGIRRAQERGAAGHVHIWPSDEHVIHEMIASGVWGAPTSVSAPELPRIPVLGITHDDGERLTAMLTLGPLRVRLESNVETGWMRLPLAVATIPGAESDDFLLVGAHIDSWYEGVTDNATGDAALLEMARILAEHTAQLRRGVRFAWWPGHSTGRYAGSTWYADTHFRDLRQRALGYLNIDSPGVRDATLWHCRYTTGEVEEMTLDVVRRFSGQSPGAARPLRAADMSFLGIGLPSLGAYRMLPIDHPDRKLVGGCAGAYWWHSPEDTLDKADAAILAADTEVYLGLVAQMCAPERVPFDFLPTARDVVEQVQTLQDAGGDALDLTSTLQLGREFQASAESLRDAPTADMAALNEGGKQLTRLINPVLYTSNGPYEMDPALQQPLLPGLAPLRRLPHLSPASDDYHFLLTSLRRQRNRLDEALVETTALAQRLTDG